MTDKILNRDFQIDELNKKREVLSIGVCKIKWFKIKLIFFLKDGRIFRNQKEFGLVDKICSLLQTYDIKREVWFGGSKLYGVNCRRFMDKNEEIIISIRDILIETNKGTVSNDSINMYCDKHKHILIRWIMPIVAWEH